MYALIVLTLASLALGVPVAEQKLEFVTFVHRHGDRSPIGTYPTDPHANYTWKNGWGELTTAGKQTEYKLGVWLRERYSAFLPKIYSTDDYRAESTDMSRTLMSAYLVLAGLYEPTGNDVWNPSIKWQPIPVHTLPQNLDKVLAAMKPCPKHARLLAQFQQSPEFAQLLNPFAASLTEVVKHAGYNTSNIVANFWSAVQVYDSINVQQENGLAIPKWTQAYYPEPLRNLSILSLRVRTYTKDLQRLSCGPLVEDILNHFRAKINGRLKPKVWHYSAHDITIVSLKQCLGFPGTDTHLYGATFILELSSSNGKYSVRFLNKNQDTLKTLVLPGCTEYCPIETFEKLVKPIIPEDWEAECK